MGLSALSQLSKGEETQKTAKNSVFCKYDYVGFLYLNKRYVVIRRSSQRAPSA